MASHKVKKISNMMSSFTSIVSGLRQGSIVGPNSQIIFLNNFFFFEHIVYLHNLAGDNN